MLFRIKSAEKQKDKLAELHCPQDDEYEFCVICGEKTNVKKSEPVERRMDYFPGSGQLCHECAIENIEADVAAMQNGFVYGIPDYRNGKKKKCSRKL